MGRISFYKSFKTYLEEMSFKSKRMETCYRQFLEGVEQNLLNFINIFCMLVMLGSFILGIALQSETASYLSRLTIFTVCLFAYLCRKKWPNFQRFVLIIACGSAIFVVVDSSFSAFLEKISAKEAFLTGDMIGLTEMTFVLSFKNMKYRSFSYLAMLTVKLAILRDELFSSAGRLIFLLFVTLIVVIFYIYNDVLSRREFKLIYDSRDKLKKFEDLLSNGFPSCVVIVSFQLESIFYSNALFREKFMKARQKEKDHEKNVNETFKKFFLQSDSKNPEAKETFAEFLKRMVSRDEIEVEDNEIVTVLSLYKDEIEEEFYYEIKLRKVLWDEQPSYAIMLNDVSDKQIVIGLKMADEQKDKVIATVSHELRTPINGIMGLLEMISLRIKDDDESMNYLDYCKSCSKLLLFLVNSILDLSQIRNKCLTLNKEWIDLDHLLEEVRSLYIFQSQKKGIGFIIEKEPNISSKVFTDKYRLIQILINLLGNAMKFTFKGSITLRISTSCEENYKLIFSVEDTGIGIQEKDQSKLFRMFGKVEQTNKNINSHGVGLGLTISNELVRCLNEPSTHENIHFESEFGKGSKFWFKINVLSPSQSEKEVDEISSENYESLVEDNQSRDIEDWIEVKLRKYKLSLHLDIKNEMKDKLIGTGDFSLLKSPITNHVLLVDDNPFNLMAAAFIMEKLGYKTHQAFNGRECIEMLEDSVKSGLKYKLILTDIQMPILDGLEMAKEIHLKIKNHEIYSLPIVAVTAQAVRGEEKARYLSYGINSIIEKPLIPEIVEQKLKDLAF